MMPLQQKPFLTSHEVATYWNEYDAAMRALGKDESDYTVIEWEDFRKDTPGMIEAGVIRSEKELEPFFIYLNVIIVAIARHLLELSNNDVYANRYVLIPVMTTILGHDDISEICEVFDHKAPVENEEISEGANLVIRLWNQKILAGEI